MQFIHEKVRINASMTQAMRYFLIEKEMGKWFGDVVAVENKRGGTYHIRFDHKGVSFENKGTILEKDFEKRLKFDMITPGNHESTVEVYFMLCTSKTEYCTEIHLMHKGVPEVEEAFLQSFWQSKFNTLRQIFNNDWIIEDRDLVLSVLRGSF